MIGGVNSDTGDRTGFANLTILKHQPPVSTLILTHVQLLQQQFMNSNTCIKRLLAHIKKPEDYVPPAMPCQSVAASPPSK